MYPQVDHALLCVYIFFAIACTCGLYDEIAKGVHLYVCGSLHGGDYDGNAWRQFSYGYLTTQNMGGTNMLNESSCPDAGGTSCFVDVYQAFIVIFYWMLGESSPDGAQPLTLYSESWTWFFTFISIVLVFFLGNAVTSIIYTNYHAVTEVNVVFLSPP